jgi:hypothetical protein
VKHKKEKDRQLNFKVKQYTHIPTYKIFMTTFGWILSIFPLLCWFVLSKVETRAPSPKAHAILFHPRTFLVLILLFMMMADGGG